MISGKKVVVVLPAFNAELTLEKTYRALDLHAVDAVVLVDDRSSDRTVEVAKQLGVHCIRHEKNKGYGANQKTCYQAAVNLGADVVVMLHPDYQYPPELVPALAGLVASGYFDVALGSRILSGGAIKRGMPVYKYFSNRIWSWWQNLLLWQKLSEYHTGFRAFSREFLLRTPLLENSDDFVFDNQLLVQAIYFGCRIGEVSTPSRYSKDSSSINPLRGTWYGLSVVMTTWQYLLQKTGICRFKIFDPSARRLEAP